MMAREKKLTPKQRRFVLEYLVDLNATQAAIRAGYSRRTAEWIGPQLLTKTHVAAEIEKVMAERAKRTGITADRVLKELARIGFLDIRKAFNIDGSLKPLDELDDDTAAAIVGIEVNEMREDGVFVGYAKKIKLADKIAALEKIARHLGMFNDKLTLKGDAENPLAILIQHVQGNALKPVRLSPWGGDEREEDNKRVA